MKIDVVKVVKVIGMALSVAGMIATGWAGDKSNVRTLEKLVDERFKN